MTIKGSCLCGTIRYEITGLLQMAGHCHCSICRKSHGAAFATWAIIDPEQFRWTAGEACIQRYASSPGRERFFCRQCGSPLAASHDRKISEVVVGTIDGDPGVRPREHIFTGSKALWHEITDALPQYPGWPPELQP